MAGNSKLRVDLTFGADTSKAKAEIQNLQKELNKLTSTDFGLKGKTFNQDLYNATAAVKEFQTHLQKATDVDTGKLDLSILSKSLSDSGKSLKDYSKHFKNLGEEGKQAFNSVTQTIMNAEVPLRKTNKVLQEMGVSLKNTIKWQISSSAVHAFMGAVQGAYGYVQDLDKSLNNIRIVTGRSADEMADFAKQANKAAKELSVSTTTYTDAALIYYQQGLEDEQVQERTNATIKMANVTGESATNVSSYMTAIWNNFDDGSKSLEYFGDVITALGAATAASSEEIAGGLEKFAAIGETVGLSYEYATAALTTIIDKTRQSEDVVGTALKTIFARIQGLKQGEETEDGVTLNKYSKALENVGISIMDNNGELKKMDDILNEMGSKWQTLSKAQQVALAQTVGGTRQYTQLIALMDNWGSMQENLNTAYNASGTLDEQAKIYAESWEAAQKRVTAALQTIYDQLLDDKFFIGVTDLVGGAIELFSKLIDTIGGLPGVLATSALAFATFSKTGMSGLFGAIGAGIKTVSGAKNNGLSLKGQAVDARVEDLQDDIKDEDIEKYNTDTIYAKRRKDLLNRQNNDPTLTKQDTQILEFRIELEKEMGQALEKEAKLYDDILIKHEKIKKEATDQETRLATAKANLNKRKIDDKVKQKVINGEKLTDEDKKGLKSKDIKAINKFQKEQKLSIALQEEETKAKVEFEKQEKSYKKLQEETNDVRKENNELMKDGVKVTQLATDSNKKQSLSAADMRTSLEAANAGFTQAATSLTRFSVGVFAAAGAIRTLSDDSIPLTERIEKALPSLLIALPALWQGITGLCSAMQLLNTAGKTGIILKTGELILDEERLKNLKEEVTMETLLQLWKNKTDGVRKKGIVTKIADWTITKLLNIETAILNGNLIALLGSLLAFLWPIAAVAAGFAAIVLVWKAIKDSTPEGQLKKANEELKQAQEIATNAASAYKEVASALKDIEDRKDALSGLAEGTAEWYAEVNELNQKVIDLLDHYGLLSELTWDNGVAGMTDYAKEEIERINKENLQNTAAYSASKTINKLQKEDKIEATNAQNNIDSSGLQQSTVTDSSAMASNHGTTVEVIDSTDAKNLVNAIIKNFGDVLPDRETLMEFLKEYFKDHEYFNNINWNALADEILTGEVGKGIRNVQTVNQNNQSDLEAHYGQLGVTVVGDKLDSYNLANFETNAVTKIVGEATNNLQKQILNTDYAGNKWGSYGNKQAAYDAYTKEAGLTLNEEGKYVDFNNNVVEVTDELVKSNLALADATNIVSNNVGSIVNQVKDVEWKDTGEVEEYTHSESNIDARQRELEVSDELLDTTTELLEAKIDEGNAIKNDEKALQSLALAQAKVNKGIEKLSEGWEDNYEILKNGNDGSMEYAEALTEVKTAMNEVFGVPVSNDFIQKNLKEINKLVEGNVEGFEELSILAAQDYVANIEIDDEATKQKFQDVANKIINDVSQDINDLEVGANIDLNDESYIASLNEMLEKGEITVDQVNGLFNSMGFDPDIEMKKVTSNTSGTFYVGSKEEGIGFPINYNNAVDVEVPVIKGANYKGGGKSISYSNSKGKTNSKKGGTVKEAERYHEIKQVIKDLEKEFDAIGKAKDRAFGKDKLALMDQEIAKLEDMKAAQSQYLAEIEKFYEKDKAAIAKYGAEFDEEGRIVNYDELMKKYGGNEKAMEALEQYEETYDLLKDKQQEVLDLQNQIFDAKLAKIEYKVDLQIDVNSDDLKYLDFLLGQIKDTAYDAAEAIANLGQQAAEHLQNQEVYTQGINDIFANHGLGDDVVSQFLNGSLTADDLADMNFTESEVEALRQYRDGLMETSEALINLREETWNKVIDAVTALGEEFDEQSERVDHAIEVMDSYRNIIDIVGKDALGISDDMMKVFAETAVNSATDALIVSKAKFDTLKAQYEETQKAYESATEAEKEQLEKVLDTITNEMHDAENEMLSDWENALEKANELFEENTKRILENFKNAMAGQFESLETLQDDFAKTRELDDMHVDDYKKIYELSKLTRDINRSMDETDNLAAKNALRDIQKEINDLQEAGIELSEYDLDYLRAKYELRLAEIALEDAQNTKNQVRMTRDSEGNWSYTYTADQDNIDNAQQNYEDKLYAIQELSTNYIKDLEEQIINLSTNLAEEIAAIDRAVYESEEAYNAEVERITNFYQQKMDILGQQMNNALNNNNEIYTQDWTNYSNATGYKISADEKFLSSFNETTLGIKTGFETMQSYQQAFNKAIGKPGEIGTLLGDLSKAYNDWKDRVDEAMKAAGTSMDNFKNVAEQAAKDTKEETDKAADSMENLKKKTEDAYKAALKAAQDFEKAYGPEIQKIIDKNTSLVTSLNSIIGKWGEIKTAADNATTAAKNYNQYASNPGTAGGGGGGGNGPSGGGIVDTDKNKTTTTTGNNNSNSYSGWILTGARNSNGYYMVQNLKTNHYASAVKTGGKNSEGKTQYQIVSGDEKNKYLYFDTGGYTGEWGPSGRLAMLHEKELVLNADDTKNMFSVVNAVRDIVKSIDLNANIGLGLGNLISAMIPSSESNLNQNIEIRAEFPYATDRNEIEAAFDNLINRASQYVNRKVK